jgi:hypothetical protein
MLAPLIYHKSHQESPVLKGNGSTDPECALRQGKRKKTRCSHMNTLQSLYSFWGLHHAAHLIIMVFVFHRVCNRSYCSLAEFIFPYKFLIFQSSLLCPRTSVNMLFLAARLFFRSQVLFTPLIPVYNKGLHNLVQTTRITT